jgi:hypothetical protein
MHSPFPPLLLAISLFLVPRGASANISQYFFEGDRSSILAPGGTTAVRVDHEELSFVLASPGVAEVTAVYHLTNASAVVEADDVAFAFVRGHRWDGDADADARTSIEVDGAPVPFHATTDPDKDGRWSTVKRPARGGVRDLGQRVVLLLFHIDFEPAKTRAVTVRYLQTATEDDYAAVNGTSGFDYLLSPAKHWASFGPLDISVRVLDEGTRFSSPFAFQPTGDTYRVHFATLPEGELHFETTSLAGLWFGMTKQDDYAAILLAAVSLATVGTSVWVGRRWAAATGRKRTLLPLLVAGPLAAMCTLGVVTLLSSLFPRHALGPGYSATVMHAFLVLLAMPIGAAVSAASASQRARALARRGGSTIRGL